MLLLVSISLQGEYIVFVLSVVPVCLSVRSVSNRVRSISPRRLEGFSWNLGHMFTSSRRCAEPMSRPSRFKVTLEGQRYEALFRVQDTAKDFTEVQSHVQLINMMCNTRVPARFKVKVKYLSPYFDLAKFVSALWVGMFWDILKDIWGGDICFCVKNNSSFNCHNLK